MNHSLEHLKGRRFSRWTLLLVLLLCAPWATACNESDSDGVGPDGDDIENPAPESYGDTCIDDQDVCVDGTTCFAYGKNTDDRFCSMQCATDADCPDDNASSCLSLDTDEGLIKLCVPNDLCIDPDEDEYGSGPGCKGFDCDQSNPNINPGAPEICDGIDNNCDGLIDHNPVDAREPCETGHPGVCKDGWYVCRDAEIVCEPNILPGSRQEICDGLDNDCDGLVDEGQEEDGNANYVPGLGLPCGNPDDACFSGYQFCNSETKQIECDDPAVPQDIPDLCTGRDDNCNGEVDEDANDPDNLLGTPCAVGIGTCRATATWSCDPDDPAAEPICPAQERTENAQPEICDYKDNDCDGVVDNGFVNEDGIYDQIEHCGQCGNNCNDRWGGDAAALGLNVKCEVIGQSAMCTSTCREGYYDLDGVPTNGCEFKPDDQAIYVAVATRGGEDTNSCGKFDTPCLTISHAISRASSSNKSRVRISEGIFKESIQVVDGISIMGGHSSRNWNLDPTKNVTTIQGGRALDAHVATIVAQNITKTTEISGLSVDAQDARSGGNSYGIYIKDANDKLTVKNNTVLAGRGGVGAPGARGSSGKEGESGSRGLDRENDRNSCSAATNPPVMAGGSAGTNSCGSVNTSGGQGADITRCPILGADTAINSDGPNAPNGKNNSGSAGNGGQNLVFAHYKTASGTCSTGGTNTAGNDGRDGNDGSAGTAANSSQADGSISNAHWTGKAGNNGGNGQAGGGGGGGGSSSGVRSTDTNKYHIGPTGGGGGAGGCEGNGGKGGNAGGASFGIFVAFSSNTSSVPAITNNTITRNFGGRGGAGGAGGAGGIGGLGGEGGLAKGSGGQIFCANYNAQPGGAGGRGGHGGGGGGGTGGASFDIATAGNSNNAVNAYENNNTYTLPDGEATGGQGGEGGKSILNEGEKGIAGGSGNFRKF